jgi:ankyrin repeat protein
MGTWGVKAFENDGAADWVDDLIESGDRVALLKPLRSIVRKRGSSDLDDSLEGLAAAEMMVAARYEPVRGLSADYKRWVCEKGFVPTDAEIKLALKAVTAVLARSELADSWRAEGRYQEWAVEQRRLLTRLQEALGLPLATREPKSPLKRANVAELVIRYGETKDRSDRAKLGEALKKLADVNRPVHAQGYNSLTPLHWVASRGLLEEAAILIERGAKVDAQLPAMARPIGFAIEEKHYKMVELLMRAGADGEYAMDRAAGSNDIRALRIVCAGGGDFHVKGTLGRSAIHEAALAGADRCVRELAQMGADINEPDNNGDTPLHYAAMFGRTRAVRALLESGAKVHAKNASGQTAMDLAREDGYRGVI